MDAFLTSDGLIPLVTLTFLEIVLGIDNVVFISILSGKLPRSQQSRARRVGLAVAMGMRILLLLSIVWVIGLTAPLVQPPGARSLRTGSDPSGRRPIPACQRDS